MLGAYVIQDAYHMSFKKKLRFCHFRQKKMRPGACTATEMIPTIEMIPATEMTPNHHRNDPHHRNDTDSQS